MSDFSRFFAAHLAMLLRMDAAGEATSREATRVVGWVVADFATLAAHPTRPEFEAVEGLTLSGEHIRLNRLLEAQIASLGAALEGHGACGLAIRGPVDREALLGFLRTLRTTAPGGDRTGMQRWLDNRTGGALQLLPLHTTPMDNHPPRAAPESLKVYGRLWYAVSKSRAARTLPRIPPEVRGAMRLLVERAEIEPRHHLALSALRDEDDAATRHAVHVAILAIALGQRLGLGRGDLVDLGLGALLVAEVPEAADEAAILDAVASQAVQPRLTIGQARRMLALYEHQMGVDRLGIPARAAPLPLHLYSRILAITNDFDMLVSRSGGGLLHEDAIRHMQTLAGRKYDKALLRMFADTLGRYPIGSAVLLDTGEVGVVYRTMPGSDARPVVRVVVDPRGGVLRRGPLVELGDRNRKGRRIVGMVDAARLGIDAADALFE